MKNALKCLGNSGRTPREPMRGTVRENKPRSFPRIKAAIFQKSQTGTVQDTTLGSLAEPEPGAIHDVVFMCAPVARWA